MKPLLKFAAAILMTITAIAAVLGVVATLTEAGNFDRFAMNIGILCSALGLFLIAGAVRLLIDISEQLQQKTTPIEHPKPSGD